MEHRWMKVFVVAGCVACGASGSESGSNADTKKVDVNTTGGAPVCSVGVATEWRSIRSDGAPSYEKGTPRAVWTDAGMALLRQDGSGAMYEPCGDQWQSVNKSADGTPNGEAKRVGAEVFFMSDPSSVLGASVFNPKERSWRRISTTGSDAQRRMGARAFTGAEFFLWGGVKTRQAPTSVGHPDIDTNEGAIFDLSTSASHPLSAIAAPPPRANPLAVWTGKVFVAWGGVSNGAQSGSLCPSQVPAIDAGCVYRSDGGLYDPGMGQWTPMSNVDAPQGMRLPTMLWTGKLALVWDQVPGAPTAGPQHMYGFDPVANRWQVMAAMPRNYYRHEGGSSAGRLVFMGNSGGHAFDPETNTWVEIQAPVDLKGCTSTAAVTYASERVIFTSPSSCHDGHIVIGRYDPKGNAWVKRELPRVPVEVALPGGAPPAQFNGVLTWTGKNLIAWGGSYAANEDHSCDNPPPNVGCDPVGPEMISTSRGYIFTPDLE